MSFLDRVAGVRIGAVSNADERYWTPSWPAFLSNTGITVTPKLALQVSCVFQGTRLYAETMGTLPLIIYREREDGGKDRARDHRLWRTLRKRPNPWQTAQQFRETLTAHAVLWGNGFAEKRLGAGGRLELHPLDPDTVTVEQVKSSRRLRFIVREDDGTERPLVQDEVFRVQGLGIHCFMGANLLHLAREAVALWIALEKFEGLFFGQGAKPGVWLKHPGKLSQPVYERLREEVQQRIGGLGQMHKVHIIEEGMGVEAVGFSAKDSQMTESRESLVLEVARWMNIPEHMFRAGKQPTYASVVEFASEFVNYSLMPWAERWKGSIDRDLLDEDEDSDIFAEYLFDALLRGKTLERFQAYALAIMNGWMSENEVRERENMNPVPGLDTPRRSANQDRGEEPRQDGGGANRLPPARDEEDDEDEETARAPKPLRRLALIVRGTARRVVRKEVEQVRQRAVRHAAKPAAWQDAVVEFYADHSRFVAEALELEPSIARGYTERHLGAVLAGGIEALERLETEAVEELVTLALEEEVHAA